MLLWAALIGCDDALLGKPAITTDLTWNRDILPIVETHCVGCHSPGNIAPFSLETYESALPNAAAMALDVASGKMPPYPPNLDCNSYRSERVLSQDEIDAIGAWADGGAPEGDSSEIRHGTPPSGGLTSVDLDVPIPEPFTPAADPKDIYRCFLLPLTAPTDQYVTGFGVTPGNPSIVHHVIAYLALPDDLAIYQALDDAADGPGWDCFGGPGGDVDIDAAWLGGWVPGSMGEDYPAGTGIYVPAGASAVVQIHYNTDFAPPAPDQTSLQLSFATSVDKPAEIVKWLDPKWSQDQAMTIGAGDPDAVFDYRAPNPIGKAATVWSVGLHQHLLGSSSSLTAFHADGSEECLLRIDDWDFHWQGLYFLEEGVHVGASDEVGIECHFDNSAGTTDVNWGEESSQEMCLGLLYATED